MTEKDTFEKYTVGAVKLHNIRRPRRNRLWQGVAHGLSKNWGRLLIVWLWSAQLSKGALIADWPAPDHPPARGCCKGRPPAPSLPAIDALSLVMSSWVTILFVMITGTKAAIVHWWRNFDCLLTDNMSLSSKLAVISLLSSASFHR